MRKPTKAAAEAASILEENAASRMTGVAPRDSDSEMIIQILQRFRGANLTAQQMTVIRSLNFESVIRFRRKAQEGGLYPPSPEVALKRRLKSYEAQQVAPNESAQGLQRRLESND